MISSSGKEPERGTLNVSNKMTRAIKDINMTKKNDNILLKLNFEFNFSILLLLSLILSVFKFSLIKVFF